MVIGFTLFMISALIIGIWVLIEVKRMKHKVFAILLIALILFSYVSSAYVFRGHDIQWNTIPGVLEGTKLYFSWLGSVFFNLKSITSYTINMNWEGNNSKNDKDDTKGIFDFLKGDDKNKDKE
ncbi:MAG: hypothetical protein PVJ67_05885 [Candidatus Pacearchaeota archaeon]|jgi:hypothetical protein